MAEPRLQPLDAEAAVLGAVLSDPLVLETVRPVLNAEDFADPKHVHVYAAMCALAQARTPIDHLTVAEALKARGVLGSVGGPQFLMALDASVPFATRAPDYARTVREMSLRRGAVRVAQANAQKASDLAVPVDSVLTEGAREWAKLTHAVKGVRKGPALFLALLDQLDAAQRGDVTLCIPTGIDRWDEVFGGLQPSKLTFLGSQPGVGKSSVFATMVENLCLAQVRTGFFSLEDTGEWVAKRITSKRAGIPLFVLATRKLTSEQMRRVGEASEGIHRDLEPLTMDDRSMLKPAQIVQTARDMIVNDGVQVIFLDHLGKVDFESRKHHSHDLAIEEGLNELTALAKDYRIPVVIAAHLKENEKDSKFIRPDLDSFARTKYIGRDARVAAGLYLDRDDPDTLLCAVLKQTEGEGSGDFGLKRFKESGMVASRNGRMGGDTYAQAERRMLAAGNDQ